MSDADTEVVAKTIYEQATGRSDWGGEGAGPEHPPWDHWRRIARAAIDALDQHRHASAHREQSQHVHMVAELAGLGRLSQES